MVFQKHRLAGSKYCQVGKNTFWCFLVSLLFCFWYIMIPIFTIPFVCQTCSLTIWLFNTGRHWSQKIIRSHVNLMLVSRRALHLQRCKVSENLVRSWVLPDAILILDDLSCKELEIRLEPIHKMHVNAWEFTQAVT